MIQYITLAWMNRYHLACQLRIGLMTRTLHIMHLQKKDPRQHSQGRQCQQSIAHSDGLCRVASGDARARRRAHVAVDGVGTAVHDLGNYQFYGY